MKTTTIETGVAGALALSAGAGYAMSGPRKRPVDTGLVGTALRSAVDASFDASTWNGVDVPTPVPVRRGGAHG